MRKFNNQTANHIDDFGRYTFSNSISDNTCLLYTSTSNWTLGYDAPTFAEGSITAKTADGFSIGGYNTPVELGTVYRFKYKNVRASGWYDGFYLGFKAANIYWLDGGVQVDFNDDSTAIHFYNGNERVHQKAQSPSIESGKEYEIEFGLLKDVYKRQAQTRASSWKRR